MSDKWQLSRQKSRYLGVSFLALLVFFFYLTPIFRTTLFDLGKAAKEPILSALEVRLVCKGRDRLLEKGVFHESGIFGQNRALEGLIYGATLCLSSKDLTDELVSSCRGAHFDSIDWLLAQGVGINGGEIGTVLQNTIHELDEEMFGFLMSRGADPHYRPPASPVYAGADDRLKELVDTVPKSAVDLLEYYVSLPDASITTEYHAAQKRMLAAAYQWQNRAD